ncbi:cytochrome P450 [Oryzobacter telluris]|uniref:cytochrome P450 n=1 Tax=Oryzobacter telluris TaxID=3149179 RepID=UPI00370D8C46
MTKAPLPPGRLGLPWLGETASIAANNHGFYTERFEKYGPIFKTRLFGINFVVLSGAEAFHRFATDPAIERGSSDPISVEQIFLRSLALEDGPEHRSRKDVMLHGVRTREAISAYVPRMQAVMERTIDGWADAGWAHVRPDLERMSARLTGFMYLGDESDAAADEIREVGSAMRAAFQTIPVPVPGMPYGKAVKARDRLFAIIDASIARHEAARPGEYDDVVSRMIAAADEHGVPRAKLRGDVLHLIFASQGGYFVPLTLATMALGQDAGIMERARREVLEVAPDGPLTMDDLDRLVYLRQISKEVRRYFAMNSANFFGKATREMEIDGYRVPAGWGAIAAIHITMRSDDVHEDADLFEPDRFLPEAEAALAPGSYVPHGDGERGGHRCPGEDIVTVAVTMYLALMLRRGTWDLPDQDLTLSNELFPLPESGLRVTMLPATARAGASGPVDAG